MDKISIMIVGVGGQGALLTSRILGSVFMNAGYDVKVSEVHGMSQRGGSVVTYVKCADKVYSPMIGEGEADYILAFEKLEAARYLPYLKPNGVIITDLLEIAPASVGKGRDAYPAGIIEKLEQSGAKVIAMDATAIAKEAGNVKSVNVAILGRLAKLLPFSYEEWMASLTEQIREQFLEVNRKAFDLAY